MSEDRCVCCGEIVPEGRMVCPVCEKRAEKERDLAEELVSKWARGELVERKKGRWIKNDFYEDALMCSCCHAYLDKEDWSRHYFYFCYHCGAFMEGMDCGADMRGKKTNE